MSSTKYCKAITLFALGGASYLAITCPCSKYLSCHKPFYVALVALAGAMAFLPQSSNK